MTNGNFANSNFLFRDSARPQVSVGPATQHTEAMKGIAGTAGLRLVLRPMTAALRRVITGSAGAVSGGARNR